MRKDFSTIKNLAQAKPVFSSLQNLQKRILMRFAIQYFLKLLIWLIFSIAAFSAVESFAFFEPQWKIAIWIFILHGITFVLGGAIFQYFKNFGKKGK